MIVINRKNVIENNDHWGKLRFNIEIIRFFYWALIYHQQY